MGRHVVFSFDRVAIGKILGGQGAERAAQVLRHVRVGIFIQCQRCRGVLNEDVEQSHLDPGDLGERPQDMIGDWVDAGPRGRKLNLALNPRHDRFSIYDVKPLV